MRRYGELSRDELLNEVEELERGLRQAEFPSQQEVLRRKIWVAKAHLLRDKLFPPGLYAVEGEREPFELRYVNGIMAWGRMGDDEEASFPISMLEAGSTK